jgi:hypothetical protein
MGFKFGEGCLKRYRAIGTLGLFGLLLAATAAFSPAPVVGTDASGFGTTTRHQRVTLNDTHQGLVLRNANPVASNTSRIPSFTPCGIIFQSYLHVCLNGYGLGIAEILPVSAREIGFHSLLRAPPASFLIQ